MCLSFRDLEDQVEKLRERLTEASEGENWGRSEQEDATECQYQVTMVVTVLMVIVRVRMVVRVISVNHSSLITLQAQGCPFSIPSLRIHQLFHCG